ncbi:MAG: hypothetical protein PHD37_01285 [Gallionellaceae bacterium]|nr:hypothetical protein [Gallionellaceae bacterium]
MLFPKLVPAGAAYVKIPNSKRAAMRVILETAQRGSRYWSAGTVPPEKALRFAEKMAKRYRANANQAQRAYAKAKGRANTSLVMYPEDTGMLRWWLLATPGEGAVHTQEQLADSHDKRTLLTWGEQYELVHEQRPKSHGGGRVWTWRLTPQRYAELEAAMRDLAASPGRPSGASKERRDGLDALVQAVMRMPGFHGVRQQQLALLQIGRETWTRTHAALDSFPWPEKVPYLDKGFACYHAPDALRLDVLLGTCKHRLERETEY